MEITITKTTRAYWGRSTFVCVFPDSDSDTARAIAAKQGADAFQGVSLSAQVTRLSEELARLQRRNRILLFLAIASPVVSLCGFGWCVVIWAGKL